MAKWHWKLVPIFWEILGQPVFKGFAKLFVPFGPPIPFLIIYPKVVIPNRRNVFISSVQLLSHVQLFVTPWTAEHQASLSISNSQSFAQTLVHQVGDAIQPSHLLSSPSPPAFNLSQHQGLFNESVLCIRWPKYSVSVLPMNIQDWFSLGWTGWISLLSKGLSKSLWGDGGGWDTQLYHSVTYNVKKWKTPSVH